jgi:hypothetical protein
MQGKKPKTYIKCSECNNDIYLWPYAIERIKNVSKYVCTKCREEQNEYVKCLQCNKKFKALKKQKRKFCCSSCSATYNNKRVVWTDERRQKTSKALKEKIKKGLIKRPNYKPKPFCKIHYCKCTGCGEYFIKANAKGNINRVTCSEKCKINACVKNRTYQNGSRKPVWYFNKNENKQVLLESSWEVTTAENLDKRNIKWIRPEPMEWFDNKKRFYYPDFYLPDFDIYLDPKNPYCMSKDKEKMDFFKNKITIVYGHIDKILDLIYKL